MNGVTPELLRFFEDRIVQPLTEMRVEIQDRFDSQDERIQGVDGKVTNHIGTHAAEEAERERRKHQAWLAIKWTGGAVLTIATAVVGARGGL